MLTDAVREVSIEHSEVILTQNAGVVGLVGTGQADRGRRLRPSAAGDRDLSTFLVELRSPGAACAVQSEQLTSKKIVSRCDAGGDGDRLDSSVGDQAVDSPRPTRVAIFSDLEPAAAVSRIGQGIGDFLQISARVRAW